MTKSAQLSLGSGECSFLGYRGSVTYEVRGDPTRRNHRAPSLTGWIEAPVEVAEAAFRAGFGYLTLEGQARRPISFQGYTHGTQKVYFEMKAG